LRAGVVANTMELARLAKVTQPRITQVLNMLHLAPDIQEELLFLPIVTQGHDFFFEKQMRRVCAELNFIRQYELWEILKRRGLSRTDRQVSIS
jgi:hypothetical protein